VRGGGGLALARAKAKRSSQVVTRTLVKDLSKLSLLIFFIGAIVLMTFPIVQFARLSANLSQENRVLETKIVELQQQIKQLENERSLIFVNYEVVRTGEHER